MNENQASTEFQHQGKLKSQLTTMMLLISFAVVHYMYSCFRSQHVKLEQPEFWQR